MTTPTRMASRRPAGTAPDPGPWHLVQAQARRTPGAVAVTDRTRQLSYMDLIRRATGLAGRLGAAGGGPGSVVAVRVGRGVDLVVAVLAVWRAGAAYLAVDPGTPPARVRFLLDDSGADVLLTDDPSAVPWARVVTVAGPPPDRPPPADQPPIGLPAGGRELAYLAYTSGSTGRPKGVLVEHRSVTNVLRSISGLVGLRASDTLVAVSALSFDISVLELLAPLTVGARVVVAGTEPAHDPALLAGLLRDSSATVLQATPTTWEMLLRHQPRPGLRLALCGGEPLRAALAERLLDAAGAAWNLYGPTETTVWSTAGRVGPDGRRDPSVGRPIANTVVHVLDEDLRPVPTGAEGELCIGGVGVARGYLNQPALTAERFVPDPFRPAGLLYRTGDLARVRADGGLELLGRRDGQVKIRGHRIELGEVEAALAAVPGVAQAVAVARDTGRSGGRLEAFVVPRDERCTPDAVRRQLADELPAALVPSRITVLDELPRQPSGKVDRSALHRWRPAPAAVPDWSGPQWTPTYQAMARLWADLLAAVPTRPDDDFFALGGTSVLAGVLVGQLEAVAGEVVYVAALYRSSTLAGFTDLLAAEYPATLGRLAGTVPGPGRPDPSAAPGPAEVARFRELVTGRAPVRRAAPPNPPAALVVSAPRSGSTLLRVMLAGHPDLFAPPELELLGYDTMGERTRDLHGCRSFANDGLLRAVRELLGCSAAEARRYVAQRADGHPVAAFYRELQGLAGDRLLVDKTTTYAMDATALRRAEAIFAGAHYVHLVRHPAASIRSYVDARLDQVFRHRHAFGRRQLAELVWLVSNENLVEFLATVPAQRQLVVRFEDLVGRPAEQAHRLADFLGVPFHEALLDPYGSGGRMVDGLYPESRMAGDVKFGRYTRIEPAVADEWRTDYDPGSLAPMTVALARSLGYPVAG